MSLHLIHTMLIDNHKRYELFGDYSLSVQRVKKVLEYTLDGDVWKVTNTEVDISKFLEAAKDAAASIFGRPTNELHHIIKHLESLR
ncbi:TPA: hypothetical protein OMU02_002092 [Klebsiella aerogenes]|nr:hypothetical protein [Klebsiella aerogenes]